jgi:hypothetical protein
MLNIKRDREEPHPIRVTTRDESKEYKLLPGGKPEIKISDKVDKEGKREIKVIARDKEQAKDVLKELQRKYNIDNQDIEEILNSFEVKEEFFKEHLTFNSMFGGEKALRATAKIILNFYIYSGGNIKWVEDFACFFFSDYLFAFQIYKHYI